MANIRYQLFEEEFIESQGAMMTRVFRTLLNRNPEKITEAVNSFYCLAPIDYYKDSESLRSAKSNFNNKQTVQAGAQTLWIDTSCNFSEKQRLVARLFTFCGEDAAQFFILDTNAVKKGASSKAKHWHKTNRHGVSYRLFDKKEHAAQADMLYHVISRILLQKPELVDWAVENLDCVSKTDYTEQENQSKIPSAVHGCRPLVVDGRPLWIAASYGIEQKQRDINCLLQKAGFHQDDFEIYSNDSTPALFDWQAEMVGTVLRRLREIERSGRLLGIISLPSGCGKSVILGELSRQLLNRGAGWSVLILTSSISIADQYTHRLKELLGGFYCVETASSRRDLEAKSKLPGILLVSASQKLLFRKSRENLPQFSEESPIYSESPQLLVIVEETSYHTWGQTYADIHTRFPNAVFLGVTQNPAPSRLQQKAFGPLLYRYSWASALEDGFLVPLEFREVAFQHIPAKPAPPHTKDNLFSLEGIREIAAWIAEEEQEQSRCSLLICQNHKIAAQYYELLLPMMGHGRLRTALTANTPEAYKDMNRYTGFKQERWDGKYFSGLVIACTHSLVSPPFHTVYLDKRTNRYELLSICSMLMRSTETRKNNGVLVSFYPIRELLEDLLEIYIPPAKVPAWSHDSLESFQAAVTKALKSRQYDTIEAALHKMQPFYPEDEDRIAAQLGFLFPQYLDQAQRAQYWEHHQKKLAWQSDLWCLLSQDSGLEWKGQQKMESSVPEDTEDVEEQPSVPAAASAGTSQQKGAQLEQAVKRLLQFLFDLDSDAPLDTLGVQGSGVQFGFDIILKYCDRRGVPITCVIECKNYDAVIHPKDILDKLVTRQMAGTKVDHWILISPHGRISNTLRELVQKWEGTDYWYPILDVQFWTPDERVQDLFSLFPEIFHTFYDVTEEYNPFQWSAEKKAQIAAHWKRKLAHIPHLPPQWKTYLRNPDYLLTERETDPETARSYNQLYRCRAPIRLLDQDEFPIEGLAEEHFFQWLQKPENTCALLLGDFGDGKSFFTYVLARRLAEEFWISPEGGWIPLRLSLRELGDRPVRFRQVFHNRLLEFCDGISSWNQIRGRYKFLIILDGLDEMSLGMNDTAVLDNLTVLEELIEQFNGYKILVTSRKMVVYSDKVRSRILSVLNKPEILHLAPLARRDCINFLEQFADTPARKRRLLKIRHTHDLIGLAEKPLFLSMVLELLDSGDIQTNDLFGIYHNHAQKTLDRKFSYQLTVTGDYTSKEKICSNLFTLLEELAIYMQFAGRDSVSLDEFKTYISADSLVQLLWSCIDGSAAEQEEDAEHRVSSRSLLKYDRVCPENRCFCHRSMKEYFVACGLIRKLAAGKDSVRELLMKSSLSYEICLFAGKAFQALSISQRRLVQRNLVELAHETKGMCNAPNRKQFAALGANCVNLLHCSGLGLPGKDWSGLVLDNAMLSGANLRGKNLSYCSMRFAHLDNADMTACDLRGCDFSGVQFERSGQLRAFTLDVHENALLAYYQDGKIRRWEINSGAAQTLAQLEPRKRVHLILGPEGQEGAAFPERFQFWNRNANNLRPVGHIALRQGIQLLDLGHTSVLVSQGRRILLLNIDEGEILQQQKFPCSIVCGALLSEQSFVLWLEDQTLVLANMSGAPYSTFDLRAGRAASMSVSTITRAEKRIVLGFEDGGIKYLTATLNQDGTNWSIGEAVEQLKCDGQIVDTVLCGSQELFAGTALGSITRYGVNDFGEWEVNETYQLDLKCAGARIEGVHPPEQYEILRRAAASKTHDLQ